jgi:hypothetical protein
MWGMRAIQVRATHVRAECEACGAHQTLKRFRSRPVGGGSHCEPEEGQWIQCRVCGDWSPFESHRGAPAVLAGAGVY